MRRIWILLITIFITSVIIYDLKIGTIPTNKTQKSEKITEKKSTKEESTIKSVKIKSGDTVLSVIEDLNNGLPNIPIKQILQDFETLNPKTDSSMIQIGKSYKFSIYKNE